MHMIILDSGNIGIGTTNPTPITNNRKPPTSPTTITNPSSPRHKHLPNPASNICQVNLFIPKAT